MLFLSIRSVPQRAVPGAFYVMKEVDSRNNTIFRFIQRDRRIPRGPGKGRRVCLCGAL